MAPILTTTGSRDGIEYYEHRVGDFVEYNGRSECARSEVLTRRRRLCAVGPVLRESHKHLLRYTELGRTHSDRRTAEHFETMGRVVQKTSRRAAAFAGRLRRRSPVIKSSISKTMRRSDWTWPWIADCRTNHRIVMITT
jgi:hypothetical protein